jgi:exodeoxyribonuclease VII small subunit
MKHTFKEAYGVLQQHAQTLRDQTEPNIDDLLTIVTESVAAYKVCQTRIDAVEKALEKALENGLGHGVSGAHGAHTTDADDAYQASDIPF